MGTRILHFSLIPHLFRLICHTPATTMAMKQVVNDMWDSLDADKSGSLSLDEVKPMAGMLFENPGDKEVKEVAQIFDGADGDGKITKAEFVPKMLAILEAGMRAAFAAMDKNGDGNLTPAELKEALSVAGIKACEADDAMAGLDTDGDG